VSAAVISLYVSKCATVNSGEKKNNARNTESGQGKLKKEVKSADKKLIACGRCGLFHDVGEMILDEDVKKIYVRIAVGKARVAVAVTSWKKKGDGQDENAL
jgi:hypothetical protein